MVEAGANEIPEAEILDALDIAHSEIKKLVAASASSARRPASPEARGRDAAGRRRPLRADQGLARAEARRGHLGRGQARPPGRHEGRRGGGARALLRRPRTRPSTASSAARRSSRSTSSRSRSSASGSRSRRSARTAAAPTRSARSRSRSACSPRTHGSALFTRGQTQALSVAALGTHARGDAARHARAGDLQALLPPLQLPAVLGRGGGLHARRRSAATSATARSPSARSSRCSRRRRTSRTRSASCRTSSSPTAPRRWPPSAAPRCR